MSIIFNLETLNIIYENSITSNTEMQLSSIQMLMWIDILRMINKQNVTITT